MDSPLVADCELPSLGTECGAIRGCDSGGGSDSGGSPDVDTVELEEFISQWLSGMVEDRIAVVLGARPSHRGALFDPAKLSEALVTML